MIRLFVRNTSSGFADRWRTLVGLLLIAATVSVGDQACGAESPPKGNAVGAHVAPSEGSTFRPGRWGMLTAHLSNSTDQPLELLASTFLNGESTLQFGRRVWVPAKSRRQIWYPVRMPASLEDVQQIEARTLVIGSGHNREVLIRDQTNGLQIDSALRVNTDPLVTAVIESPIDLHKANETRLSQWDHVAASDLVTAARVHVGYPRRMISITSVLMPNGDEPWQAFDQLVIADDRLIEDAAGLAAVRRWMFGGGHVWVMLDRAGSEIVEQLLGEDFVCQPISRIGLTTVRLLSREGEVETTDYEQPIDFVRVAVSNVQTVRTVDGWPAAFWKDCGEGRLLVTTLGARGWMRERRSNDPKPASLPQSEVDAGLGLLKQLVNRSMEEIALDFMSPRLPPLLPDPVLEPRVQEYVGYSIAPRWLVSGLLLSFSIGLAVCGLWFQQQRRLEWMGLLIPGFAVAMSGGLMFVGWKTRQAVPTMVANLQLVQPITGTTDVRITGVAGIYSPSSENAVIAAEQGGWLLPDLTGSEGTTRRLIHTDLGRWHWENLPSPVGVRRASFTASKTLEHPLEAHATFDANGLTGQIQLPASARVSDAILATREGRFSVDLSDDGKFRVRNDHILSNDQYLAAGLLSDEQRRHSQTLQNLLNNPLRPEWPAEAQLIVRTSPWDVGFRFAEGQSSGGAAVVTVPIQLNRPASGTEIFLAAPWLPFRTAIGPDGTISSALWDATRRIWLERAILSEAWFRFELPKALLPVVIQGGQVRVQVTGPIGKLSLAVHQSRDNSTVPLKTWIDPVGTVILDLDDPSLLNVTADGGFLLQLSGGDPDRPELTQPGAGTDGKVSYWQIESLKLDLRIKTVDSAGKDAE